MWIYETRTLLELGVSRCRTHNTNTYDYTELIRWIVTARQMGFKDRRICPDLCRLASEYISKCEGFEDDIYAYFENEPDCDSLYVKLVEEFERCILSYFGFHWNHCDILISQVCLIIHYIARCFSCRGSKSVTEVFWTLQVLSSEIAEPKKKLKHIVMAATRCVFLLLYGGQRTYQELNMSPSYTSS
jgi:hypothetical protein